MRVEGSEFREYRQSSEELFSESSDEVREPDVRLESDGTADIAGLLTWIVISVLSSTAVSYPQPQPYPQP